MHESLTKPLYLSCLLATVITSPTVPTASGAPGHAHKRHSSAPRCAQVHGKCTAAKSKTGSSVLGPAPLVHSFIPCSKWPGWQGQSHLKLRVQRSRPCQRLVSVNMVCSFLTVLKPLTVSTNSSSSMNCDSTSGLRPEPVPTLVSERAQHTFLGSLTIPLSWPDVFGSHVSSSTPDFPSIIWLTLRLRELTLRTASSP